MEAPIGKIKTYSLVSNYFQIHFIKGEFEIDDNHLSFGVNMKELDRLGEKLENRVARKLLDNKGGFIMNID